MKATGDKQHHEPDARFKALVVATILDANPESALDMLCDFYGVVRPKLGVGVVKGRSKGVLAVYSSKRKEILAAKREYLYDPFTILHEFYHHLRYFDERHRGTEKIKKIEEDIHKTQVNKKTEHHIGLLRAKLAKLRLEQEEQQSRRSTSGTGYDVKKSGDATVVLIGLPSVGKSTLLNRLTNAKSKVAAYEFTTLDVVPGVLDYKGARIQVLDLPGIIQGASSGRGLGKRVLAVARNSDLVLFVVDVFQPEARTILEKELRSTGIRVDENPPKVVIEETPSGGIAVTSTVKLTKMTEQLVKDILRVYDVNSARVMIRQDISDEQLIDVLLGNRIYIPSLTLMNKIDLVNAGFTNELTAKLGYRFIPVSAESDINISALKEEIYKELDFVRIYMRRRTGETDFDEPMIIRNGSTVLEVCNKVHRNIKDEFRYALIWGRSVKFGGQRVGINHRLMDEDILTLVTK